jgi:hypothetical protein
MERPALITIGAGVVETAVLYVSVVGPFEQTSTRVGVFIGASALTWLVAGIAIRRCPPDVTLEFTTPGPFVVRTTGAAAAEVNIEPLEVSNLYRAVFRPIGDVHPNEPITIEPRVEDLFALHNNRKPSIMDFLEQIARSKAIDLQSAESDGLFYDSATTSDIVDFMSYPIEIPIRMTFSSRDGKGARRAKATFATESLVALACQDMSWRSVSSAKGSVVETRPPDSPNIGRYAATVSRLNGR